MVRVAEDMGIRYARIQYVHILDERRVFYQKERAQWQDSRS